MRCPKFCMATLFCLTPWCLGLLLWWFDWPSKVIRSRTAIQYSFDFFHRDTLWSSFAKTSTAQSKRGQQPACMKGLRSEQTRPFIVSPKTRGRRPTHRTAALSHFWILKIINLPIEPWPSHLHHQTPRTLIHLLPFLFAKPALRDCHHAMATLQAQQLLEQQEGPFLSPPFTALGHPLRDLCRKRKSSEWLTKLFN